MSLKVIYRRAAALTRSAMRFALRKIGQGMPSSNFISDSIEIRSKEASGSFEIQSLSDAIGDEDLTCALNT
jgi:hypothetical protein